MVERFFQYRNMVERKRVKFVACKFKGSTWAWWEQLQKMSCRLRNDLIKSWEKMKKYFKRVFVT